MSIGDVVVYLAVTFGYGVIVYLANKIDCQGIAQRYLVIPLVVQNMVLYSATGLLLFTNMGSTPEANDVSTKQAWVGVVASLFFLCLVLLLLSRSVRDRIAVLFPRASQSHEVAGAMPRSSEKNTVSSPTPHMSETPLFPQMLNFFTEESASSLSEQSFPIHQEETELYHRGFDPASMVHMVAAILCIQFLSIQFFGFIYSGGLAGIAEGYPDGLTASELLVPALPFIVIPFVGVGLGTRRDFRQAVRRLGLTVPGPRAIAVAGGTTLALFGVVIILGTLWQALVSPETYEEQTKASDAIAASVSSIGIAFLLALTAATGEEIAFRGALQPVFGLWPTAIIFTLTHVQYTFTPAWLIIFVVAVTFGWLREHYGTSTSMLTHFLYNFIPLSIAVVAPESFLMLFLGL